MTESNVMNLFNLGMIRNHPDALPDKKGLVLNLGPGEKHIAGALGLEWPGWDAETNAIPFSDNSVDMIHCYHFLEHIQNSFWIISEIERVLRIGGHINIVVPYYTSNLFAQDLDHKTAFNENTWKNLFDKSRYVKNKVNEMNIHFNMIMGDCEKNLALVTQLVKI